MTVEQVVAAVGALTALIVATTALLVQVTKLRGEVNGRLSELVAHAVEAAEKRGELAGRDFAARVATGATTVADAYRTDVTLQRPADAS